MVITLVALAGGVHAQTPREAAVSTTPPVASAARTPADITTSSPWMVSETRSPIDYSPVAVATASANGLQLAIHCRGGRSELMLSGASTVLSPQDHLVSYAIDGAAPVAVAVGPAGTGAGLALKGDVPRFLASLPARGEVAFRVADRAGASMEGRYDLAALSKLVRRLAVPCGWPATPGG